VAQTNGARRCAPYAARYHWIGWVTLAAVAVWLLITQRMTVQIKEDRAEIRTTPSREIKCERFPDQCPCTTELGKGVA
jgi:hypothetical protein